jgi:uncharacterized protein (DUF433 family)
MTTIHGVVRGKTIELATEPGLPDGQAVTVTIERVATAPHAPNPRGIPPVESWMDRLVFDPAVDLLERIVKGTTLQAEALVAELERGRSDDEMLQAHPQLAQEDVRALRDYACAPDGLRQAFGGWAEDAEQLDEYLAWTRRQRKIGHREIED